TAFAAAMNNSAAAIATAVRRAITGPLWGVFGLTVSSGGPPLAFVSFAVLIAVDPLVVVRARPASFVAWGFRSATMLFASTRRIGSETLDPSHPWLSATRQRIGLYPRLRRRRACSGRAWDGISGRRIRPLESQIRMAHKKLGTSQPKRGCGRGFDAGAPGGARAGPHS